jgi:hypothetical protein
VLGGVLVRGERERRQSRTETGLGIQVMAKVLSVATGWRKVFGPSLKARR